jgi:hypothetical protein
LKRIVISGVVAAVFLLLLAPASGAAVRIVKIYFDPPGADTGSNSSLNDEWIPAQEHGDAGAESDALARPRSWA